MRRTLLLPLLALALGACGDDGGGDAVDPGEATTDIEVTGTDGLAFEPDAFRVPSAEEVSVTLTSEPSVEHDFVVADVGGEDVEVVRAAAGETGSGTISIDEPGTYDVYCSIPGHRQAGMEATLEVAED